MENSRIKKVKWLEWDDSKQIEEVKKILDRLREEETVILVEGENDLKALRNLNIRNKIIKVSENQKRLFSIIEGIGKKWDKAIILTDWDSHGDKLASKIHGLLQKNGIEPLDLYRRKLKSILLKEINDVESMDNFIKRNQKK